MFLFSFTVNFHETPIRSLVCLNPGAFDDDITVCVCVYVSY